MTDAPNSAATAADAAKSRADVQQKIGYIGSRLREKSTYGGLAVVIGVLAHVLAAYFPELASIDITQVADAVSMIGIGVGTLICIIFPEKSVTGSVVKILLVAFALSAFLAGGGPAFAQSQIKKPQLTGDVVADTKANFGIGGNPAPKLTGNLEKDAQAVWKKIVDASITDLTYASALAGSANTNGGNVRKQCWDAIIALNKQVNGASLKNPDGTPMVKPDPSLFTDVEMLAETIDNLSPQGALFTSCAGASQLAKTNVLTFINAAVTGAAGIAAMPIIPGL